MTKHQLTNSKQIPITKKPMSKQYQNSNDQNRKRLILKPKAKVYIDGANMFYTQKALGWFVDFKKIKKHLEKSYDLLGMKYYTGIKKDDEKMKSFLKYLDKIGIEPITKPLKKIKDKKEIIFKSNFDVEMTMDILLERQSYDVCLLFSGDSDFYPLVKKLQNFGKKVVVYSTRRMISWELKLAVDQYVFLEDLKSEVKKTSARRRSRVKLKK